jgi:hypothetical protein
MSRTHTVMLGWLGSSNIVDPKTLSPPKSGLCSGRSPERVPDNWTLGIIGSRGKTTYDKMQLEIIQPMVAAWGLPSEVLVPSDGDSSHILVLWAQQKDIPIRMITSDWSSFGPRAALVRNTTIQKEADRLIFLQGPRSTKVAKDAARLAKKGRIVGLSERPGSLLNFMEHK